MTELKNSANLPAIEKLQHKLNRSLLVLRSYDWLVNSYVLDFYVHDHWSKLPSAWRTCLESLEPEKLSDLLSKQSIQSQIKHVWPLALLALKQLFAELCVDRTPEYKEYAVNNSLLLDKKLKHLFTKCVKPKKRHEIERMAAICKRSCNATGVDFLLDFGAGQGHLARVLGYNYGVQVCCLEMQNTLNEQAIVIDKHLERIACKHLPAIKLASFRRPTHITLKLDADTSPSQLLDIIKASLDLPNDDFRFGIVGLHPCGDLGVILMRMLLNCPQAQFLMFAGCCYMKLSTMFDSPMNTKLKGYPLSSFMCSKSIEHTELSYAAREISCHAAEMYYDRLSKGDYEHLKVHSYRAAAERIIVKNWPELRHCGLRGVKHTQGLQFQDYFYKAVQGLPAAQLPLYELETLATKYDLAHWKRIVIFYTLRLMFAPLVESIILYDRALFMLEHGCDVKIEAVFEPRLSPRNHITTAIKKK